MERQPHDLDHSTDLTLAHYNQHAKNFRVGTRYHDVNQNIDALLRHIEGEPPTFSILGAAPDVTTKCSRVLVIAPSGWMAWMAPDASL
jgi:hypothetical protein